MDGYTDEVLTDMLEAAIRVELTKQAVNMCFYYYFSGELTPKEALVELEHYYKQILDWGSTKELPGWAKDSA